MYTYEQDWKIINYIATGVLDEAEPNRLAPNFTEPLGWMGERLSPSPLALDEAEMASYPNASERDVDIFEASSDYGYELEQRYEADHEAMGHIYHLFGRNEFEVNQESLLGLDKNATAEARYALTTYDSYYRSMDHDGYEELFYWSEPEDQGEWSSEDDDEHWDSDEMDEEDDISDDGYIVQASIRHRGLLRETPIVMHRNLADVDLAIMFPDELRPIPPNDTELIDPLYGPPKWFHVSEKSYFEELRSIASV
jgi:hypothetical protein